MARKPSPWAAKIAVDQAEVAVKAARIAVEAPKREHQRQQALELDRQRRTAEIDAAPGLLRLLPTHRAWMQLGEHDEKVEALDRQLAEAEQVVQRLTTEVVDAENGDRRALADFFAEGGNGDEPEPTVPQLRAEQEQATRRRDALVIAANEAAEAPTRADDATFADFARTYEYPTPVP